MLKKRSPHRFLLILYPPAIRFLCGFLGNDFHYKVLFLKNGRKVLISGSYRECNFHLQLLVLRLIALMNIFRRNRDNNEYGAHGQEAGMKKKPRLFRVASTLLLCEAVYILSSFGSWNVTTAPMLEALAVDTFSILMISNAFGLKKKSVSVVGFNPPVWKVTYCSLWSFQR